MKKFCIWCEDGTPSDDGYLWIHKDCLYEIEDGASDLSYIREHLEKITKVLENSKDFAQRWKKTASALSSTEDES